MQFIYYTDKSTKNPRECPGFFSFGKRQDRKAEVLGEGAATPCHQLRVFGERCELPSGVRAELRSPKDFHTILALRVASPDTIILLRTVVQP